MQKPKYTTEDLRQQETIRKRWKEARTKADQHVASIRKSSRPLEEKDENQLAHLAEKLAFHVAQVDQYITDALQLKKENPGKSGEWFYQQFPQAHYTYHNQRIRDIRARMKGILNRYTFETVDYPDPELHGLTTYRKPVEYARVHPTVWKYYNILEETVTLLKKDRDEFIQRGGNPALWMPPF